MPDPTVLLIVKPEQGFALTPHPDGSTPSWASKIKGTPWQETESPLVVYAKIVVGNGKVVFTITFPVFTQPESEVTVTLYVVFETGVAKGVCTVSKFNLLGGDHW